MSVQELEKQCFEVLGDEALFEEDRVDKVEDLVSQRFPNYTPKQRQKIVMEFMWKHQDPTRAHKTTSHVVSVHNVETKVDIPDLERRLHLERQFLELDAMNQAQASKQEHNNNESRSKEKEDHTTRKMEEVGEYQELLRKTNELKQELYGDRERPMATPHASPIEHISAFFGGSIPRMRINQALKTSGYSVLDAVQLIISQLKREQDRFTAPSLESATAQVIPVQDPFFDPGKKNKALCSFFVKHGKCLRSDCQFSHDIEQRVCAFWLNGRCAAGDQCLFKHSLDDLSGYGNPTVSYQLPMATEDAISHEEAFPPLPSVDAFPALSATSSSRPNKKKKNFNAAVSSTFIPAAGNPTPQFVSSNTTIPVPSTHFIEPYSQPRTAVLSQVMGGSSAIAIVKPLRKPKLIPWEAVQKSEHLQNYITHRTNAIKFENQRRKFAQISTDAWRSNDGAKSKQMSDRANKLEQKCFDALKLADDELYNYSESTSDEVWFELHGLEFNEAIEQLESALKEVKNKTKNQTKVVYIVVPSQTYDFVEYKKTTKPISLWLDHEGYRWQLHGCGNGQYGSVIAIDPFSK